MQASYRLGHLAIEPFANAQALVLVTISLGVTASVRDRHAAGAVDVVLRVTGTAGALREIEVLGEGSLERDGRDVVIHCGRVTAKSDRHVLLRLRCAAAPAPGQQTIATLHVASRDLATNAQRTDAHDVVVERAVRADVPPIDRVVAHHLAAARSAASSADVRLRAMKTASPEDPEHGPCDEPVVAKAVRAIERALAPSAERTARAVRDRRSNG